MEINEHIDALQAEGTRLADSARVADLDAVVPYLPGWTVREVVTHVGGVHRWAADIVARAAMEPDTEAGAEVGSGPPDDELLDWFVEGHAALVRTLRAAPPDLECYAFLPAPSPLAFWARRQALETAVHRTDVAAAVGPVAAIEQPLALDGIDEMLLGFGARPKPFEPALIRLEPAGGTAWDVTLGAERLTAVPAPGPGTAPDATVGGSASDVYLWLWNRPSTVTITGDSAVTEQWKKLKVRWS
jgi:uncharacterized protein (TIGR03083 family)